MILNSIMNVVTSLLHVGPSVLRYTQQASQPVSGLWGKKTGIDEVLKWRCCQNPDQDPTPGFVLQRQEFPVHTYSPERIC